MFEAGIEATAWARTSTLRLRLYVYEFIFYMYSYVVSCDQKSWSYSRRRILIVSYLWPRLSTMNSCLISYSPAYERVSCTRSMVVHWQVHSRRFNDTSNIARTPPVTWGSVKGVKVINSRLPARSRTPTIMWIRMTRMMEVDIKPLNGMTRGLRQGENGMKLSVPCILITIWWYNHYNEFTLTFSASQWLAKCAGILQSIFYVTFVLTWWCYVWFQLYWYCSWLMHSNTALTKPQPSSMRLSWSST